MNDITKNLASSFAPQNLIPSLSFALIAGMQTVFLQISIAALVFSGPLAEFAAPGMGLFLFGALIMSALVALTSSALTAIAYPQEGPVAILGVVAAALVADLSGVASERLFATMVAAIMVSTVLAGALFLLMGRFNLGQLVRYIPYPVGGGFLAGTGWLLFAGGIGVMTDSPLGPGLLQPEILIRWLPGVLFGLSLLFLLRRYFHFLLLPSVLIGGIGLFYLVYYASTGSVASAEAQGWLLGPLPTGGLWQPGVVLVVTGADWGAVARNVVNMSTILLISMVGLLLNATGLEIATRTDIDLNRELRVVGIANVLAGLGGSPVGFHSLSLSSLGHRLGVRNRLGGIFSAVLITLVLLFGAGALAVFPKLIVGGFLIFLGLSFLGEWVYETWFILPRIDYLLIWLILLTIVIVGFLEGVAVGIGVAVVIFVIDYSRIDPLRHTLTGAQMRSRMARPRLYEQLLQQRGDQVHIVVLQGFLFFGSANRILERVRARFDNPDMPQLRFLILDFRLVTGVDSSARFAFSRLAQLAQSQQIKLVLTHLSPEIRERWQRGILADASGDGLHTFPDLDAGLAWCEEQTIDIFTGVGLATESPTFVQQVAAVLQHTEQPTDWLAYLQPGTAPAESPLIARLQHQLQRVEVAVGERIVRQGEDVTGLYILDVGEAVVQRKDADGTVQELEILTKDGVIGETDLYTRQRAAVTVVASQPCTLLHLSTVDLREIEAHEPQLAIAIHRALAAMLGEQLARTGELVRALRR